MNIDRAVAIVREKLFEAECMNLSLFWKESFKRDKDLEERVNSLKQATLYSVTGVIVAYCFAHGLLKTINLLHAV